jgi:hypothetical protein
VDRSASLSAVASAGSIETRIKEEKIEKERGKRETEGERGF